MYPKIELHVHLEGTVRADTLRTIAKRNDYPLPDDLESLYRFRGFRHFIDVWVLTTNALQTEADFRQMVVDYAAEAASHGAVYLEGIFSPAERARRGVPWEAIFDGVCNGAQQAREQHGVEIRLTPDITRGFTQEEARATVDWSARYRDRGVVGVGLGGLEAEFPPEPYEAVFAHAKSLGLGSAKWRAPTRCAGRSRRCRPTASATASGPRRIPASSASWQAAAPSSTCARSRTSARGPSARSTSTPSRASSLRASTARSRPTTRRCSTPT
jgi:adenosine/AMP deaminase-like protein